MALNTAFPLFTERLEIRTLESDDVNQEYIEGLNNTEYLRFSRQSLEAHTMSSQLAYIEDFLESSDQILAVILTDYQQLVGTLTLRSQDLGEGVDVGIFIFPKCSGNRYASEAWNALINHLSLQYLWISGGCAKSNLPMISIMESSNMTLVGEVKQSLAFFHGREDALFYRYYSASKDCDA